MVAIIGAAPSPAADTRFAGLDALRGIAILAMVVFHLGWDLTAFGLIGPDLAASPGWTLFGRVITVSFLGLAGFNLVLATRHGLRPARFLRRLAVIGAAAVAVSLGTWLFDAQNFVFFGILHCIALGSVFALPFLRAPSWLVAMAAAAMLAAPRLASGDALSGAAWYWLGLTAEVPPAADYVPILPWFGVILLGLLAGRLAGARDGWVLWRWQARHRGARALTAIGRWSLAIYLLHQPLLVGLLMLAAPLAKPAPPSPETWLRGKITAACAATGTEAAACAALTACVLPRLLASDGLAPAAAGHGLTAEQADDWAATFAACEARQQDAP